MGIASFPKLQDNVFSPSMLPLSFASPKLKGSKMKVIQVEIGPLLDSWWWDIVDAQVLTGREVKTKKVTYFMYTFCSNFNEFSHLRT
jgi:hypothetical protein